MSEQSQFKDHFSGHARDYARFRPDYPQELYDWSLSQVNKRELAWDCATGNGQAARELARYFRSVDASDASANQIKEARGPTNVRFHVWPAEQTELQSETVDLVNVSQALHWFNFAKFFHEVKRVLKPGAVLICNGYGFQSVAPQYDPLLFDFYENIVGPYWPPERRYVEDRYRSIPIPFQEYEIFEMKKEMSWADLLGYLGTWSASQKYKQAHGKDPIIDLQERLAIDLQSLITVRWQLFACLWRKAS